MNVFELTRALVDIESISDNEARGRRVSSRRICRSSPPNSGGRVERMDVEAGRFNVLATWGKPIVTLSTHMDTVPPFFPSREDAEHIWGRGSCDAKGIIASMVGAAEKLLCSRREKFRAAFRGGRGAQQRRRDCRFEIAARLALPDQRRTHGKQAGAGLKGRAALRADRSRDDSRTPPIRNWANRPSKSCWTRLEAIRRVATAGRSRCWAPAR